MIEIFATEFIKQLVKGAVEEVRSTVSDRRKRRISEEEDRIKIEREVFNHKRSEALAEKSSAERSGKKYTKQIPSKTDFRDFEKKKLAQLQDWKDRSQREINLACHIDGGVVERSMQRHQEEILDWSESFYFREMSKEAAIEERYVQLSLFLTPKRRHRIPEEENAKVGIDTIWDNYRSVFLYGAAGSGKTTSLKHLARSMQDSVSSEKGLLAFTFRDGFVDAEAPKDSRLRRGIRKAFSLNSSIQQTVDLLEVEGLPEDIEQALDANFMSFLNDRSTIIMCDGLDELPESSFIQGIVLELSSLNKRYPKIRFLVTCRSGEVRSSPDGFDEYEIAPLSEEQVRAFVSKWVNDDGGVERILSEIATKEYLEVSTRPIVLAYICSVFQRTGQIPPTPRGLLQKVVDLLVEEWDEERFIERHGGAYNLDRQRKREILKAISFFLSFVHRSPRISSDNFTELTEYLERKLGVSIDDVRSFLSYLESQVGVLIQVGHDQFELSHKTLQEFLAAEFLLGHSEIPLQLVTSSSMMPEISLAIAMSSDSERYLGKLAPEIFEVLSGNPHLVSQLLKRLSDEKAVFGGDAGLDAILWLLSGYFIGGVRPSKPEAKRFVKSKANKRIDEQGERIAYSSLSMLGGSRQSMYDSFLNRFAVVASCDAWQVFEQKATGSEILPYTDCLVLPGDPSLRNLLQIK